MIKKLKIALILIFILILCGAAHAKEIADFKTFPAMGSCTGNSVRIREQPNLNSEILARLNEFDKAIVLGSRVMGGKKWYEVELPRGEGTGWVAAEYLIPFYDDEFDGSEGLMNLLTRINQDFGITPDKARLLFTGDNVKFSVTNKSKDKDSNYTVTVMTHENYTAQYINDNLNCAAVFKGRMKFGDIKIGDTPDKIIKILGKPTSQTKDNLTYLFDEGYSRLEFSLDAKGRVDTMMFAFTGEI